MQFIQCPNCGSTEIWIFEYLHVFRRYQQESDGINPESYEEEAWPEGDPITFECGDCDHEWASEEANEICELL